MLTALELRDFAIVDELRLELSPGLNVLTGETGAGKSILIDALALLTGERADPAMIRSGAESALIQGIFEGREIRSAARRLAATGRNSARLDGELVTVGELAARASALIAIHGQNASQALQEGQEQRRQLDRLLPAEASQLLGRYRKAYRSFQDTSQRLEALRGAARERARRLDILRFQLDEITGADLRPGEDDELEERARSLRNAERLIRGAGLALAYLTDGEGAAVDVLAAALKELDAAGRFHGGLENLAAELRDGLAGIQATAAEVERFLAEFEVEPGEQEEVEARLARIDQLKRKYGDSLEAVLEYGAAANAELRSLESAEADLEGLTGELEKLRKTLEALGGSLLEARREAAEALQAGIRDYLERLAMPNGRFQVEISPVEAFGPYGRERVRFLFSANLGEPLAPLGSVASGGELSRLMLALNLVTGTDFPTLAFDEVDAGIGGTTARAVGTLLRRLAEEHQVLVVTHLPQVAAFADVQFHVEKREVQGRTVTRITRLDPTERELELARMLSGAVTDASLRNARELLSEARG